MHKSLLILLISSLLILSGCSAKDDLKEQSKKATTEQVNLTNSGDNPKPVKTAKRDRSDEILAPDFKLATLDGNEFNLSEFRGKVVLLNFWGTWCPPCRKEIPDLIKLQQKYNQDGLEIVGITMNSGSSEAIKKFVDEKNMNYTILTDIEDNETGFVQYLYSQAIGQMINALPTTLIIDREGYIVKGYLGPRPEEVFFDGIKEYL